MTARIIEKYLKIADPTPATSGNLFKAVDYGTSVHGGWNKPAVKRNQKITAALQMGGLATGIIFLRKRK
jgi:hypothetical protein